MPAFDPMSRILDLGLWAQTPVSGVLHTESFRLRGLAAAMMQGHRALVPDLCIRGLLLPGGFLDDPSPLPPTPAPVRPAHLTPTPAIQGPRSSDQDRGVAPVQPAAPYRLRTPDLQAGSRTCSARLAEWVSDSASGAGACSLCGAASRPASACLQSHQHEDREPGTERCRLSVQGANKFQPNLVRALHRYQAAALSTESHPSCCQNGLPLPCPMCEGVPLELLLLYELAFTYACIV